MDRENSEQLYETAKTLLPGGVNTAATAWGEVGTAPVFIHHAKGAKVYDEDENEYVDYVNSWGPCILGHANDKVVQAVKEAAEGGLSFGAPTRNETILAELIRDTMPVAEKVRFVNSGTEAVMSAVRLARAYTNREYIIKFECCDHGHSDEFLIKEDSIALSGSAPASAGVPATHIKKTLLAEYNDIGSVEELLWRYQDQIAAIVVEPVAANMGLIPPKDGFLEYLRDCTYDNGCLLIFDEVITGYRLRLGGACEFYHITPDLICLGRVIGGGLPMGMYGGRKEIMDLMEPEGPVCQAGTLSGNPIATAAGIATISELIRKKERYSRMQEQARQIEETVKQNMKEVCVSRAGSMFCIFFTKEEVTGYKGARSSDQARYAAYFKYMLDRGIYLPPSQFKTCFLSMAHKKEDIKKTCDLIKNIKKTGPL